MKWNGFRRNERLWLAGAIGLMAVVALTVLVAAQPSVSAQPWNSEKVGTLRASPTPQVSPTASVGSAASEVPGLSLGISAQPSTICAFQETSCGVGVPESEVTMTAQASPNGLESWPSVQVAFVIETTAYDGVYDPSAGDPGGDVCAQSGGPVCEMSNGVCFFVTHAQQIANAIQAANPHSQVSFALVDYFATLIDFDDGDGAEYHVDIPTFISPDGFGPAVAGTLQAIQLGGGCTYSDSDLYDNIIHSSSITALFGTIIGSGLDWSPNTHHVIVWQGSTCPRAIGCSEDYSVSPSDYAGFGGKSMSSTCEPSYTFGTIQSPNCEGWVTSEDGNATHSIAALARTAPECTDSIGGVCTIDMIDLWDGVTDPWSRAWPSGVSGGGPMGVDVQADVARILLAGCELAAATGGTWNGPAFFTCPNGQAGSLQPVFATSTSNQNTANPSLYAAYREVGFGPIQTTLVANGTKEPLFQFVPFGSIKVDTSKGFTTRCTLQDGVLWQGPGNCGSNPAVFNGSNGFSYYGWNWSARPGENSMYLGDVWSVQFWVYASGPPYAVVPVDSCITLACKIAGSTSVQGVYTSATYTPVTNHSAITQSWPVATVDVQSTPPVALPTAAPPPPPPPPPGIGIPIAPTLPALVGVGIPTQVGVGNVAMQATAAGWIAAGFMRVTVKNRPISMAVAALSGKTAHSKFESAMASQTGPGLGRFE